MARTPQETSTQARQPAPRPRTTAAPAPGSGFSLLEVLVASALLGMLVLAILPLFTRAALLNQAGRRATIAARLAGSRAEELLRRPFAPSALGSLSDDETSVEYRTRGALDWTSHRPQDPAEWIRTTTLRFYPATALDDRELSADEVLPTGAGGAAQLQEIEIEVRAGNRRGPFGAGARASLRVLKAQ
jgi:prepilin-type N-terminal cleavage/methylation domain-containing protein